MQTDKQLRINNYYETTKDIDTKTDLYEASQNKLEKETKVTLETDSKGNKINSPEVDK